MTYAGNSYVFGVLWYVLVCILSLNTAIQLTFFDIHVYTISMKYTSISTKDLAVELDEIYLGESFCSEEEDDDGKNKEEA